MIAVPVAGEPVGGFSCAWLMVARNSIICARTFKVRAQSAPANNSPRTGVIFIVVTGEQRRVSQAGTHQNVTTWLGLRKRNEVRANSSNANIRLVEEIVADWFELSAYRHE